MVDVYPPAGDTIRGDAEVDPPQNPGKGKGDHCKDNGEKEGKGFSEKEVDSMISEIMNSANKSLAERMKVYYDIVPRLAKKGRFVPVEDKVIGSSYYAGTSPERIEKGKNGEEVLVWEKGIGGDQVIYFNRDKASEVLSGKLDGRAVIKDPLLAKAEGLDILGGILLHELVHANQCGRKKGGEKDFASEAEAKRKQAEFYKKLANNSEYKSVEEARKAMSNYARKVESRAKYDEEMARLIRMLKK